MKFDMDKVLYNPASLENGKLYVVSDRISDMVSLFTESNGVIPFLYCDGNGHEVVSTKIINGGCAIKKAEGVDYDGNPMDDDSVNWNFWYPLDISDTEIIPYSDVDKDWIGMEVDGISDDCSGSVSGIRRKDGECYVMVLGGWLSMEDFLKKYRWNDGSPCGLEVVR